MNNRISLMPLVALMLCAATALAEPDTFGLGTGRDGVLTVMEPRTVINRYAQVTRPLAPRETVLSVSSTEGFAAGDLVMVLQTVGFLPEPQLGAQIDLSDGPVGQWELARLDGAGEGQLKLRQPILRSYEASVTQVIRVPEYTDVTVRPGASIVAAPWDGRVGGVLAFLAQGTLRNAGEISASGAGFRGGFAHGETSSLTSCGSLPLPVRPAGTRGEGVSLLGYGLEEAGFENASSGGGGGTCPLAGGGGGGNGAPGEGGGDSVFSWGGTQAGGGQGGAQLVLSLINRLTLGGGGGLGHGGDGSDKLAGSGGGAVFIRGGRLIGQGSIRADGDPGHNNSMAGGSGGGAGGSIYLRLAGTAECGGISAQGGAGGAAGSIRGERVGAGGAGGGGQVLFQASWSGACRVALGTASTGLGNAGEPSLQPRCIEAPFDASCGVLTRLAGGFRIPAAPTVEYSSSEGGRLHIVGEALADAEVILYSGGREITRVQPYSSGRYVIDVTAHAATQYGLLQVAAEFQGVQSERVWAERRGEVDVLATVAITQPDDVYINTSRPLIEGTVNPSAGVAIKIFLVGSDGETEIHSEDASVSGGGWTYQFPQDFSLADGNYRVEATIDTSSNQSDSHSFVVDTVPPEVSIGANPPDNPTSSMSASFTIFTAEARSGVSAVECKLDSGEFEECTSPKEYTSLSDGDHVFEVRVMDGAGNQNTASYPWKVDATGPVVTIEERPDDPTNSMSANFTFSIADAHSEVQSSECRLDAGEFEACTSSKSYFDLPEGDHTFEVHAVDELGNQTTVTYPWKVDTTSPETSIEEKPAPLTNETLARFTFSATDTGGSGVDPESGYECSLDGAAFVGCTSPTSYPVEQGEHTFKVRAVDLAGNLSAEVPYAWSVDTQKPETEIVEKPENPTNETTAHFTFFATDTGGGSVQQTQCSLDGAPFADCTSRVDYPSVGAGSHIFSVRAVDSAGNTGETASYTWVVDTTAPVVTIGEKPADPTNITTARFTFSATEEGSGVLRFECKLDEEDFTECTTPHVYAGPLSEASHTFSVRAVDHAGNTGEAASYTWVVDTTAPVVTIGLKPANPTSATEAGFTFSATEEGSGVLRFECKLDDEEFAECTTPHVYAGPLSEGSYTFSVRAVDHAGNIGEAASHTWVVDTTAPVVTIGEKPADPTNITSARFTFSATEEGSGVQRYECKLDTGDFAECPTPQIYPGPLSDGSHTLAVRAVDWASNTGTEVTYTWVVDSVPPVTQIDQGPPNPSNSTTVTFSFSGAGEDGKYWCSLDGGAEVSCDAGSKEYTGLTERVHTFCVAAQDAAGNRDASAECYPWTLDLTPPDTVLGPDRPRNPTNETNATFTFSGAGTGGKYWCSLNGGEEVACGEGSEGSKEYTGLTERTHTFCVAAQDAAGNRDQSPACYPWVVDLTPPDTTIGAAGRPPNPTNSPNATFNFTGAGPEGRYWCKLDTGSEVPCDTGSQSYTDLLEGEHTFCVAAQDAAGNRDPEPDCYTWTVDLSLPDTEIIPASKPPNPTNRRSATFLFSGAGENGQYRCSLDDGPEEFCNDGSRQYTELNEGSRTFCVYAIDAATNRDPDPDCHTWVVDITPPDTELGEPRPPDPTRQTTATFSFSGAGEGGSYRCTLDTQPEFDCSSGAVQFTDLSEGGHNFSVYAVDAAGNRDQSPASYGWVVDVSAPVTVIENASKPPNPANSTSVTFVFTGAGDGGRYMCSLDSQTAVACDSGSVTYTGLGEDPNPHTFSVYAIDAAGNQDLSPDDHSWVVDLEPPETSIIAATEDAGPLRNPTNARTVTFRFSGAGGSGKYQCKLDTGPLMACDTGEKVYSEAELPNGTHTFSVYAEDSAGNVDTTPEVRVWVIDRKAPNTSVNNPRGTGVWRTNQRSPTFSGTAEAQSIVSLVLDGEESGDVIGAGVDGKWSLKTTKELAEGEHGVSAWAVDGAGNEGSLSSEFRFIVDTVPPDTRIINAPPKEHNSRLVLFTFNAPGELLELSTTFECTLVSHRYDKEIVGSCNKEQLYNLATAFEVEDVNGDYTLRVAARDEAGNLDLAPAAYDWTVTVNPPEAPEVLEPVDDAVVYDLTPPISGKTVRFGKVSLTMGDKRGLAEADENGLWTFRFPEPLEQTEHQLTAMVTDVAGNPSPPSEPISFTVVAPKPVAHAIGGGLGCAASSGSPWLALLGLLAGSVWSSRRRRR